ncbi:MAG TPA: methylated-DNA--[protein]-cysteine S-methyltransferase [Phycisphaerae bacterium]|jgi:methylated-DNA-[protein]-cysteine S-methyltransferase|nr:methylated-DNA--[protein]-cysteine S-methyltransferase [Phycisphaerae bacterium]HOJ53335.1 methylated-DNA--[protein]-cysteine S-methyltransferase [Phycisphaerae bacterium]HOL27221.1 methylated-DNA--[protein]-cysteine S-methyltransferase [Phycisphaerae bacterium]HPP21781.1 methylated-DNA--[protein]-cysteine S-methyltransferase [Phycisphaerae bacterium]HPU34184.1 methylated-DNA--[protein]-cysteine S-methyltransferase [Phycisphaerae bacterium]
MPASATPLALRPERAYPVFMQRYTLIKTPVGHVGIVASAIGLSHIHLMRGGAAEAARRLERLHPGAQRDDDVLPDLQHELGLYFSGRPVCFTVTLDLTSCTEFQRRVLRACSRIEYGQTITYGGLARRVGCPTGARAVGGVMARNPVPLVIPCHRVVGCNGSLGGFSAEHGVSLKKFLLNLESKGLSCSLQGPGFGRADVHPGGGRATAGGYRAGRRG